MLPEIMLYVSARTRPELAQLGLRGDAVALWSRATRCRSAWAPHEARCHATIRAAIADLDRPHTALILGSGLVRDVPLDDLVERFQRVVLVDAVHLWPARRRARHPKVELVTADLSGVAAWLAGKADRRLDPLASFRDDARIDLVVSANMLSQLPMAVETWRERHPGRLEGVPTDIARRIVAWHLEDLAGLRGRVCLLTDVRHREIGRDGKVIDETDLLDGETLPEPDDAWDWEVAPRGEVSRAATHIHRVHAFRDFARARARHASALIERRRGEPSLPCAWETCHVA
jgi:hypothetical protein